VRRQYFDIVSTPAPRPALTKSSAKPLPAETLPNKSCIPRPTPCSQRYGWLALPAGALLLGSTLVLSVLSMVTPGPPLETAAAQSVAEVVRPEPDPPTTKPPALAPWRLEIPSLGLQAAIQSVGVTKDGNMAVPSNYTDVGWYNRGARPGTAGTAVLAGHVNDRGNQPAVFGSLHKLQPGDELFITDKAKPTLRFKVIAIQTYDVTNAPLDKIFTSSSGTHLNLITCSGQWNAATQDYAQRLVVFTELAD